MSVYYPFFGHHDPLSGIVPMNIYPRLWNDPSTRALEARSRALAKRDKSKFHVCLDVQQFLPEEISVKTIGHQILVEAMHEEKQDEHGYIMRHFIRKYNLPEEYEPHDVVSEFSSDGILIITAPRDPIVVPNKNERIVPIVRTGPVEYSVKELTVEHDHEAAEVARCCKRTLAKNRDAPLAIKDE